MGLGDRKQWEEPEEQGRAEAPGGSGGPGQEWSHCWVRLRDVGHQEGWGRGGEAEWSRVRLKGGVNLPTVHIPAESSIEQMGSSMLCLFSMMKWL